MPTPTTGDVGGAAFGRLHPVIQHHVVNSLGWAGLRALQREAIEPILRGDDALLLAPTAGGKTEAAVFPLLTRMQNGQWDGLSVLYVCPLKALLNNVEPRLPRYAGWLGRAASVRHGDTPAGVRRRQLTDRPRHFRAAGVRSPDQ
ncbi:MAG: DEAD/DEAH box helicase [Dermatophilaceae bacterium]